MKLTKYYNSSKFNSKLTKLAMRNFFTSICIMFDYFVISTSGNELTDIGNEYCQFETFTPRCSSSEVILIENAKIGRIKKGKCITDEEINTSGSFIHDPKYFGCSTDVTDILHERCFLKQECSVKVSDQELKKKNPCLLGLNLHLEANFKCLEVFQTSDENCHLLVSSRPKYLVSKHLINKRCGTRNNPWILEAPKGQKITMELADKQMDCGFSEIILVDEISKKNVSLCDTNYQMRGPRSNIFTSSINLAKMLVTSMDEGVKEFLLKFKSEGCLDIIPPEDKWLKRNNDDIVVGCYSSKQTWYIRCEKGDWTGSIGNCTQFKYQQNDRKSDYETNLDRKDVMPKHQQILIIVSIFGIGVVTCSLIVCFGAMCAKKYSSKQKKARPNLSVNCYEQTFNKQSDHRDKLDVTSTLWKKMESVPSPKSNKDLSTYFVLEND